MPLYNTNTGQREYHGFHGAIPQPVRYASRPTPQISCPPAPRILPILLPQESDEYTVGTPARMLVNPAQGLLGAQQVQGQPWALDFELEYQCLPRPVVDPTVSFDMPPCTGHMWGARGPYIYFAYNTAPATNPPLMRLRLMTPGPYGTKLDVIPAASNQFVTVGDVKRVVITWMRGVEEMTYGLKSPALVQRITVRGRDGTAMAVDAWSWRGLVKVKDSVDLWAIQL